MTRPLVHANKIVNLNINSPKKDLSRKFNAMATRTDLYGQPCKYQSKTTGMWYSWKNNMWTKSEPPGADGSEWNIEIIK